jgi:hypothetical protein
MENSELKQKEGCRYLHLLDSAVSLGVFNKHRSTSYLLQRVVRKHNALELASGCSAAYGLVRSQKKTLHMPLPDAPAVLRPLL